MNPPKSYLEDIGKTYGSLTVINKTDKPIFAKDNGIWFLCQCICGNRVVVRRHGVLSGGTRSCGCSKRKNIVGNRYGKLVVVEFVDIQKGLARWMCECDCGQNRIAEGSRLRRGQVKDCGCGKLPAGESAFNKIVDTYKRHARNRRKTWSLTSQQVREIVSQKCFYCGKPPSNVSKGRNGDFSYNGIDRIDNEKGYEIENVVPCCGDCNLAKRKMSLDEFKNFIIRVYRHWIENS